MKLVELDYGTETLIQDLVLANSGHVTSTLLKISQLIDIIDTAKPDWNFKLFFLTNKTLHYIISS